MLIIVELSNRIVRYFLFYVSPTVIGVARQ